MVRCQVPEKCPQLLVNSDASKDIGQGIDPYHRGHVYLVYCCIPRDQNSPQSSGLQQVLNKYLINKSCAPTRICARYLETIPLIVLSLWTVLPSPIQSLYHPLCILNLSTLFSPHPQKVAGSCWKLIWLGPQHCCIILLGVPGQRTLLAWPLLDPITGRGGTHSITVASTVARLLKSLSPNFQGVELISQALPHTQCWHQCEKVKHLFREQNIKGCQKIQ